MKTAETNRVFQSQVLPIIQKAETKIKMAILFAFLYAQPKTMLFGAILQIVAKVKKDLPTEFGDLSEYTNGLIASADRMVIEFYNKPQLAYNVARNELLRTAPYPINITTPKQLSDFIANKKDLWAEAKGSPNVTDYPKVLKQTINRLSEMPATTEETGKKAISLWQKAELDTRYEGQLKMLADLKENGVELAYISTHPNCSKRCQCWQGSLVDLKRTAVSPSYYADKKGIHYKKSTFIVDKLDGKNVYSLTDIMNCVDAWGYNNNIIIGFNCRHRLIPYKPGHVPPTKYDDKDVAKERNIEIQIREIERKIRALKTKELMYNKSGDIATAKSYRKSWKTLEKFYKSFCEKNGYAWHEYRIEI